MKPRLLDLFCGAGGAAKGYHDAGFEVVGVDIASQPNFPFEFIQADALEFLANGEHDGRVRSPDHRGRDGRGGLRIQADLAAARGEDRGRHGNQPQLGEVLDSRRFDAIHASPPCQAYSVLRRANPDAEYPDLIAPTRGLLEHVELPWVMENVPGAPLSHSIELCGSTFGLGAMSGDGVKAERMFRQLRRHRLFETNFPIMQSPCQHYGEALGVYGGGPTGRYAFENGVRKDRYGRRGGYQGTVAEKREAMGIDWMNASEINQAIPPAYTEHIGGFLLRALAFDTETGA